MEVKLEPTKKLVVNFLVTPEFKADLVKAAQRRNVTLSSFLKMAAAERMGNLGMNHIHETSSTN